MTPDPDLYREPVGEGLTYLEQSAEEVRSSDPYIQIFWPHHPYEWQGVYINHSLLEIAMINLGHISETKSRQPLPGQDAIGKQLP